MYNSHIVVCLSRHYPHAVYWCTCCVWTCPCIHININIIIYKMHFFVKNSFMAGYYMIMDVHLKVSITASFATVIFKVNVQVCGIKMTTQVGVQT